MVSMQLNVHNLISPNVFNAKPVQPKPVQPGIVRVTKHRKCKLKRKSVPLVTSHYTVGHKKTCHFYFYDNFGKCGPISIILSLLDSQINCGIR